MSSNYIHDDLTDLLIYLRTAQTTERIVLKFDTQMAIIT